MSIPTTEAIFWLDSGTHLSDGWMDLEVVKQQAKASLQMVLTVGQVVYEDADVVVVGLSVAEETVFGAQVIAKSNIRQRGIAVIQWEARVAA